MGPTHDTNTFTSFFQTLLQTNLYCILLCQFYGRCDFIITKSINHQREATCLNTMSTSSSELKKKPIVLYIFFFGIYTLRCVYFVLPINHISYCWFRIFIKFNIVTLKILRAYLFNIFNLTHVGTSMFLLLFLILTIRKLIPIGPRVSLQVKHKLLQSLLR